MDYKECSHRYLILCMIIMKNNFPEIAILHSNLFNAKHYLYNILEITTSYKINRELQF